MAYDNLMNALIKSESGGDPNARNPASSAGGLGQFIDPTWLDTVKRHRPDVAQGKTDAQILQLKFDPNLAREMTAAYASDNANFLKSKGIEPTPGAIKLAHFAGPGGAAAIYADPGKTVEALLGHKAVAANPFLRGKTGADAISWADGVMSPAKAQAQNLAQTYAGGKGDENAPLAPAAQVSGSSGQPTLAGDPGVDRLKAALGGYDSDKLAQSDKLISDAQKLSGAGNWASAIGGPGLAGIGGYQRDKQTAAKKEADAAISEKLQTVNNPAELARILMSSPDQKYKDAGIQLLAQSMGPKSAPTVQNIKGLDPITGDPTERPVVWNGQTGKYEPLQVGGAAPAAAAEAQPQAAPAMPAPQPAPMQAPQSVAPPPVQPQAVQNVGEVGPGPQAMAEYGDALVNQAQAQPASPGPQMPNQAIKGDMLPVPQPAANVAPAAPVAPPASIQTAQAQEALPPDVISFPRAANKSILGEGNVQQLSPDGSGFLYRKTATGLAPVVESKAAADARNKGTEKRAENAVEAEQQQSGVKNIIKTARGMVAQPGFDEAIKLSRADIGSTNIPWGGGEVSPAKAGYAIARASNPNSPAWGVMDDINATQERLKAVVARPLFKGQGSVSDSERKMISELIGNLSKSSSRADYQFRLNSIENMIDDMYAGKLKGVEAYSARPTTIELKDALTAQTPEAIGSKVSALAKKYNVPGDDMKQYVISQWQYVGKPGEKAAPASAPKSNSLMQLLGF